jgi:hypothetical protein
MVELAERVERSTTEHLTVVVKALMKSPSRVVADDDFLTYGLATEVFRFFFGNAWTNENVFPMHTDVSPAHRAGRKFLKTESTDLEEQFRHMQRVTSLAEIVFNLQGIEGLRQRVSLMDKHDLEAALGEMENAALLATRDFQFRFVTPTGVKGQDYEGEILTSTGRTVCCEMKSRSEQASPSHQTLWRTFEQARKQLPKSKPAMILVKIPEAWARKQDIRTIVEAATVRVFRQSQRIVAIVFTWEEWNSTPEGFRVVMNRVRPYPNKRSNLFAEDIDEILSTIGRANNRDWVRFRRLVEKVRAAA